MSTAFPFKNAAAFFSKSNFMVRRLLEGGVYYKMKDETLHQGILKGFFTAGAFEKRKLKINAESTYKHALKSMLKILLLTVKKNSCKYTNISNKQR